MKILALLDGSDASQLAAVTGLGPHKRGLYGKEILALLHHRKPA
jgi:hypothetical protein